jgi:myo-inositol-1(or 4)-monophosphatase
MQDLKTFAIAIAHEAGAFLKKRISCEHVVHYKGEINIVTGEDRGSEEILKSRISKAFPDHGILAEESSEIDARSEFRWIIDPLDGTTNYAHGYPVFCVSVALEKMGQVVLGVVFDPMRDETFVAVAGEGAFLNGHRISVSATAELSRSLLATGFPYDLRENRDNNLHYFIAMSFKCQAVRRAGAAALDLAYTSAGRFDGFWELRLKPWDTAAASLLVREAGGMVSEISGDAHHSGSPHIVASNGKLHREIMSVLKKTDPLFCGLPSANRSE